MTNFMPERAIEVAVGSQFFRLIFSDGGGERAVRRFEDVWLAHDVCAQKDRSTVTSRQVSFVRQNRRSVAAARLPKIGNHIVYADRNIFAHALVMIVRQRIFQSLQPFHRLPQRRRLLLPRQQQTEREESLHAVKLIVVSLVRSDLCIEILEVTS